MTDTRAPHPPCRIIAAVDLNHNGDPELARRLIDAARDAGVDGIKFQKRTVALAAVRSTLDRPSARNGALGPTYRKALERVDLPADVLARLCEDAKGLEVLVVPYDLEAFAQVAALPFTRWKIDPPLAVHLPLLEAVGRSQRSVVAGVAGCTARELEDMVGLLPGDTTLVHTLRLQPFTAGVVDIAGMLALGRFGRPLGYADNSLETPPALTAVALGATVIEKPVTLDRALPGPEHGTSLLPHELRALVAKVRGLEAALASEGLRDPGPSEMDEYDWNRVSIVAAQPIARGTVITRDMLALKPPGRGLAPRFQTFLEGRRALYDIGEDDFVTFGMVEL